MARPAIKLSDDHLRQIETLAGYGLTEAAIAHVVGISERTWLRKKQSPEVLAALQKGKALAESQIGRALYVKAVGGDLGAIVWWEKTRAGRVDATQVRHADAEGGTISFTLNLGAAAVHDDRDSA